MKYYGKLGFVEYKETAPGLYVETISEYAYYGDTVRIISHWQGAEKVTEDVKLNNQISVVIDPYALENYANLRYVTFMNSKWKVSAVEIQYPRLVISFGGLYHEQK